METEIVQELSKRLAGQPQKILFHARFDCEYGHVVKKNNRPIWRGRLGKSKKLQCAEQWMEFQLKRSKLNSGFSDPISTDVWCIFIFYFKNYYTKPKKKGDLPRRSLTLGDQSNLYQLPEDCMVETGILSNDAYICSHDLSRRLPSPNGRDFIDIFVIDYPNEPGRF
jgi:Holliday junction resolvase RusA-like endonuclease